MNQNNKLSIEDVYKSYGNKLVLDNIDLKVAAGELCTLVGPSGCGKSTLLRLLLGQEFADAGSIIIDGAPARHPDPHRGIVYQKYSLFPHMTVFDNVMAGSRLSKQAWYLPWKRDKDDEAFAISMLERLRLVDAMRKFPHELSGGMQQRVAIAQALMSKPPLLLMDEPFGALDPDTREQMQIYLMELHEEHKLTIFFVTHDLDEACYIGTRLLVLSQYYTDDRGEEPTVARGAKIVGDYRLAREALPTTEKSSAYFKAFVEQVRANGFSPNNRCHVRDFNLKHPHSFQTLTREENQF
ncbi:ABC transporter ATP-binding protein [Rheinheimera baltica]|uniref:ABC transporter ATP-binding protein n=1 Tax=Rheinheimera baltica TaxID=67576 RepID=A0ABT9I4P0_9GAMM|nr:ABC transporter ATP-binding protein [Rheinheimera baltica]MDP5138063.1 ABC transporter ATP-binding protein [Rheinheimera baltica]MDP5151951.1 ABC transporter ATP-binding protein [Rheinheimera baltica]